jgi:hypothetical protein
MHLCTCVNEEGGDGEGVVSEAPSLLSYTLIYVSLEDLGRACQFGLREPMHLCTCVSEEGGTGRDRGRVGSGSRSCRIRGRVGSGSRSCRIESVSFVSTSADRKKEEPRNVTHRNTNVDSDTVSARL